MREFDHRIGRTRVVFGRGTLARLGSLLEAQGARRVLLVGTPGRGEDLARLAKLLDLEAVAIFDGARQHVPVETVDEAMAALRAVGADTVVSYGGGSSIGLAKAMALREALRLVFVPTTYSGSEMTHIYGVRHAGSKETGRDERVRGDLVVYDVDETLALPLPITIPSLFNAMAHAAEALYAPQCAEEDAKAAEQAIASIAAGLRVLAKDPGDADARAEALYGAHLAGSILDRVGMALHHKLAHVLGGTLDLPHAETHTVLLPHSLAYNRAFAPDAMARIARALEAEDAPTGVYDLQVEVGAPIALGPLGLSEGEVPRLAKIAAEAPYPNPRPLEEAPLRRLLLDALHGVRPAIDAGPGT